MAHSLSAKKRVKQDARKRTTNRARKSEIKTEIKHFDAALAKGDAAAASEAYRNVVTKLDKTAASSTMHKRTAARKKSRLARKLNALDSKKG